MQHIHIKYLILHLLAIVFMAGNLNGQNNTGIGTSAPHPSALLQVNDSSRGVLIPRTDTLSVLNYINKLNPNPGIADGLLIFDTLLNTYVYYDAVADDWKILLDLVGPRGPKGPQGPTGPRGDTGVVNDWRDSSGFDEKILARDTCGDWFFDASSGKMWKVWCDTLGGLQPRRWVDTVLWDKPIGNLNAPEERVVVSSITATAPFLETMANDTAIVDMKFIPGLSVSIPIEPDEIAYVWVTAHGTVGKAFAGTDMSYAQYDLRGSGGDYYRSKNMQHIVSIGPNHPTSGRADLAGWSISGFFVQAGSLTDAIYCRCFTPYQNPGCACSYGQTYMGINLVGGNRYSGSSNTSILILSDAANKETVAHINTFAIIRRNPNALPRKR